jgi:hypothetical protein
MIIRKDKHGLYIRSGWYLADKSATAFRPGDFSGHSHAWNTTEAGLKEGDKPKTSYVNGTSFIRIKMPDGSKVYWGSYGRTEGDFSEEKE